jgi:hypothetical protein
MRGKFRTAVFSILAILAILFALAPISQAGNEDDPELSDAESDVQITISAVPQSIPASIVTDAVDILKAWFSNENENTIQLTIKIKDMSSELAQPFDGVQYLCWFTIGDYRYLTGAYGNGGYTELEYILFYWDVPDDDGKFNTRVEIGGSYDAEASTINFIVPRELLHYPTSLKAISEIIAHAGLYIYDPTPISSNFLVYVSDSAQAEKEYEFKIDTMCPLSMIVDKQEISCESGGQFSLNVSITNEANESAEINMTAIGIGGWEYDFQPKNLTIPAHCMGSCKLNTKIPEQTSESSIKISIEANSNLGNAKSDISLTVKLNESIVNHSNAGIKDSEIKTLEKIPGFEYCLAMLAIGAIYCIKKKCR